MPPALGALLFALAIAGAVLLVVAEFSTVIEVRALTAVVDRIKGHERHGYALLVIALISLPFAVAAAGRSRPAMLALACLGLIATLIVLVGDVPDLNDTGLVGARFENAKAQAGSGFYLETLGMVFLLFAGVGQLVLSGGRRQTTDDRRQTADG